MAIKVSSEHCPYRGLYTISGNLSIRNFVYSELCLFGTLSIRNFVYLVPCLSLVKRTDSLKHKNYKERANILCFYILFKFIKVHCDNCQSPILLSFLKQKLLIWFTGGIYNMRTWKGYVRQWVYWLDFLKIYQFSNVWDTLYTFAARSNSCNIMSYPPKEFSRSAPGIYVSYKETYTNCANNFRLDIDWYILRRLHVKRKLSISFQLLC